MNTLDDVYRAFGEAAEAAALLETEFGTTLLFLRLEEGGLTGGDRPMEARVILDNINHSTLGQLIRRIQEKTRDFEHAAEALADALAERNRLFHHFFRQHNNRRNSVEGRATMLADLEALHATLLTAYKVVMKVNGDDLGAIALNAVELPTKHLKI